MPFLIALKAAMPMTLTFTNQLLHSDKPKHTGYNSDIKHTTSNSLQNMDNKGIFGPILEVSHRTPSCVRLLQQHIFKERFPSSCQDFNKERAAPRESLAFSRALEHFLLSHRHRMLSGITPPLDLSNSQVPSETAEQWLPQN